MALSISLMALAACSAQEDQGAEQAAVTQAASEGVPVSAGRPRPNGEVDTVPGEPPPAAIREGALAWIGRWAAGPELCRTGAWDFREDGIGTAGETSCRIREARRVEQGAELMLTCTAEGNTAQELWTLDALPADAMRVRRWTEGEERPFAEVVLGRC